MTRACVSPKRFPADVVLWAITFRRQIKWEDISARWCCHRATAYRWLADLNEVRERAIAMKLVPENGTVPGGRPL